MLVAGFDPNQITVDLLPLGPQDIYFFSSNITYPRKHNFNITRICIFFIFRMLGIASRNISNSPTIDRTGSAITPQ